MLAAVLASVGLQACSDNLEGTLEPKRETLVLTVDGHDKAFTVDYGAEPNSITLNVKSNTLWKVEVECEGGWCTTNKVTGRRDETVTLSILENINKERNAFITVYIVDANGDRITSEGQTTSIMMTLKQDVSDVRLAPASFEPFKPQGNERQRMQIDANVAWTLDITYEGDNPTEFITITPTDDRMISEGNGKFRGDGSATFDMTVLDNRTAAERRAFINLQSVTASYSVEIIQNKSEYTFDVSADKRTVEPQGGTVRFGVLSYSKWTVSCSDPDVTFSPGSGEGTGDPETTIANVSPNVTDTVRTIKVHFQPEKENYIPQDIVITQQPFTMTFNVNRGSLPGVVENVEGETYTINVSSTFKWRVTNTPDWISVTPDNDDGSLNTVTLDVTIARNVTNSQRPGIITVEPLLTKFYEGIEIDPRSVGIVPDTIHVIQYGGQQPAISVPWVSDGITQEEAVLKFNYYSPYVPIEGAGLQWRRVGDTAWNSQEVSITDRYNGTVTVRLTGLDPVTRYEARGYVIVGSQTLPGSTTEGFTTAGRYPGSTDNPTPSR